MKRTKSPAELMAAMSKAFFAISLIARRPPSMKLHPVNAEKGVIFSQGLPNLLENEMQLSSGNIFNLFLFLGTVQKISMPGSKKQLNKNTSDKPI